MAHTYNLTLEQKKLARTIVKVVREGTLGEEFGVVWGLSGPNLLRKSGSVIKDDAETPTEVIFKRQVTKGKLRALANARLILLDETPRGVFRITLLQSANDLFEDSSEPEPSDEKIAGLYSDLEILDKIDSGLYGNVYRARQKTLDRIVAVKIIKPERADAADIIDHAKALARVSHPNIVTVHAVEQLHIPEFEQDFDAIVMEWLEAEKLGDRLASSNFSPDDVVRICTGVLRAVQYMHDKGIVHRDLHIGNVFLHDDLTPKIIDIDATKEYSLAGMSTGTRTSAISEDVDFCRGIVFKVISHSTLSRGAIDEADTQLQHAGSIAEISETVARLKTTTENQQTTLPTFVDATRVLKKLQERYEHVFSERDVRLPVTGFHEAALVLQGKVKKVNPSRSFINELLASQPEFSGWRPWVHIYTDKDLAPYYYEHAWEAFVPVIDSDSGMTISVDFWCIDPKGNFSCLQAFPEDLADSNGPVPFKILDFCLQISRVAEILACAQSFAQKMAAEPDVAILECVFQWKRLRGRYLTNWVEQSRTYCSPGRAVQDEITVAMELPVNTGTSGIIKRTKAVIDEFFLVFGGAEIHKDVLEGIAEETLSRRH